MHKALEAQNIPVKAFTQTISAAYEKTAADMNLVIHQLCHVLNAAKIANMYYNSR